jgi:hypothetical protein
MTPEEIEKHFGKEALDMLYDCILQNPVHELADWILMFHTSEQIGAWINTLKADMEDEE